jgi:hypothetical protein
LAVKLCSEGRNALPICFPVFYYGIVLIIHLLKNFLKRNLPLTEQGIIIYKTLKNTLDFELAAFASGGNLIAKKRTLSLR